MSDRSADSSSSADSLLHGLNANPCGNSASESAIRQESSSNDVDSSSAAASSTTSLLKRAQQAERERAAAERAAEEAREELRAREAAWEIQQRERLNADKHQRQRDSEKIESQEKEIDRLLSEMMELQSQMLDRGITIESLKTELKTAEARFREQILLQQAQFDRVEQESRERGAKIAELSAQLHEQTTKATALSGDIHGAAQASSSLRESMQQQRVEIQRLESLLHQSQQESSEEQARLKAEISRLESEQKTIFEQLEQQVAEKQLFETQYAQFQDEFEAHHQEHQELMLTHKQLLKEKQDLEAELAAWPAKAESMMQQQAESRFGPLVRELDEQKAMASQRETQLQQQHQLQMQKLQHEFNLTQASLQQQLQQSQALQLVLQQQQQQQQQSDRQIQSLQSQLDKERMKTASLVEKLNQTSLESTLDSSHFNSNSSTFNNARKSGISISTSSTSTSSAEPGTVEVSSASSSEFNPFTAPASSLFTSPIAASSAPHNFLFNSTTTSNTSSNSSTSSSSSSSSTSSSALLSEISDLKKQLEDERANSAKERHRALLALDEAQTLRMKVENLTIQVAGAKSNTGPRPYAKPSSQSNFSHASSSNSSSSNKLASSHNISKSNKQSTHGDDDGEMLELKSSRLGIGFSDDAMTEPDFSTSCDLFDIYLGEVSAQLQTLKKACSRLVSLDPVTFSVLSSGGSAAKTLASATSKIAKLRKSGLSLDTNEGSSNKLSLTTSTGEFTRKTSNVSNNSVRFDESGADSRSMKSDDSLSSNGSSTPSTPSSSSSSSSRKSSLKSPSSSTGGAFFKPSASQRTASQQPDGWGQVDPFAEADFANSSSFPSSNVNPAFLPSASTTSSHVASIPSSLGTGGPHPHQQALDLALLHFSVVYCECSRLHTLMQEHLKVIRTLGNRNSNSSSNQSNSGPSCCWSLLSCCFSSSSQPSHLSGGGPAIYTPIPLIDR